MILNYMPLNNPSIASLVSLSISSETKSSADISFCGNGPNNTRISIGIEYKRLGDLISSIHSGRLNATQIQSLTTEYDVVCLLISGEYRCGTDGMLEVPLEHRNIVWLDKEEAFFWFVKGIPYQGPFDTKEEAIRSFREESRLWQKYSFIGNKPLPWGYVESFLLSLSAAGINHKHFSIPEDCAQWIGCAYRWYSKKWEKHHSLRTFDKSKDLTSPAIMYDVDSLTKSKMEVAKGILPSGLGYERCLEIAKHFNSIYEMMIAGESEWVKIKGIGKVLAKSIVSRIRETQNVNTNRNDIDAASLNPNLSLFGE
jgi:ERCC4-type nuclease